MIPWLGKLSSRKDLATQQARVADHIAAEQLMSFAHSLNAGSERKEIVETLKPLYERRSKQKGWDQHLLNCLRNMGRPEEVASAVFQLCTPDFGYVTGTEVFVTGGQHLY